MERKATSSNPQDHSDFNADKRTSRNRSPTFEHLQSCRPRASIACMMRRICRRIRSYDSAAVNPVEWGAHAMLTTPKKEMTAEDLRKNMLSTYFTLRTGIVVLAAALPVGLLFYSLWYHHGLEEHSMSAFYGAYGGDMRNWFVGILCAVGVFLNLYKGFSGAEDWVLSLAGGFAILTAITPCYCWGDTVGKC
jgi:hypothetical protein